MLNAKEEMEEVKEKLIDARSKFMVRFLRLDIIKWSFTFPISKWLSSVLLVL